MNIIIEKESEDRLSIIIYRFLIISYYNIKGLTISLDCYSEQSRKTTRHKYNIDKIWTRLDGRHNTIKDAYLASYISQDIVKEAKEMLKTEIDQMTVEIA